LIRGQRTEKDSPPGQPLSPLKKTTKPLLLRKPVFRKKKIVVGVNIGYNDLRLVKINQGAEMQLLDYLHVPLEGETTLGSPEFSQFLKSVLVRFCGSSKKIDLWSAISSAKVEMRYLRIPKVSNKQVPNAVYWTFRKEVSFNEKLEIFDFMILGDISEKGLRKTEVIAYSVPKTEIKTHKDVFANCGFPLKGLSIVPFLLQNLLKTDWIKTEGENVCSLYVGRDWSRIDIFSKRNLVLSRGIKAGIHSMIEAVRQGMQYNAPASSGEWVELETSEASEQLFEEAEVDSGPAREVFFDFMHNRLPAAGDHAAHSFGEENIFKMIHPALERLVRQVERTLEHYALHFDDSDVKKIYISGPISTQALMVRHIGEQLALSIDVFDPFAAELAVSGSTDAPDGLAEREAFVPAVGMALSSNAITPNFIYTYKDKENVKRARRFNQAIFLGLIVAMAGFFGFYLYQGHLIEKRKFTVERLKRELTTQAPPVNRALIEMLVQKIGSQRQTVSAFVEKYEALAIIGELSRLTPAVIRLNKLEVKLGGVKTGKIKVQPKLILIDGVVSGERVSLNALLAEYLVELQESPVFRKPRVKKKSFEFLNGKEVMRFSAELDLS